MESNTLLAVCVYKEAAGEIPDGRAAVAQVILNRTHHRYQSDGTVLGTIMHPVAFSWLWFDFVDGKYTRVARTAEEAQERAVKALAEARAKPDFWAALLTLCGQVRAGTYHGPAFDHLTGDAVLYLNPAITAYPPDWANPANHICDIGRHSFYRDHPPVKPALAKAA